MSLFVFSRLGYCNSVHTRINTKLLSRLWLIQNATARVLLVLVDCRASPQSWLLCFDFICKFIESTCKILLIPLKVHLGLSLRYIPDMLILLGGDCAFAIRALDFRATCLRRYDWWNQYPPPLNNFLIHVFIDLLLCDVITCDVLTIC